MKNISILIPKGKLDLGSIAGTFRVFSEVNRIMVRSGKQPAFKIQLVGNSKQSLHQGLFKIQPDITYEKINKAGLIIIPAIDQWDAEAMKQNKIFVPWIIEQYKRGAEIASICTGAFLLASTGLVNGKNCSTHWAAAEDFRQMYPDVKLVTEKLITDEDGIYTNGGAFSFLNLMLYLVEKYCGREVAIYVSKLLEIDIDRNCQSPFSIFLGQKSHTDEPVKTAQQFIENNVSEKISVDDLATNLGLSKRNFERRFKKATTNTPVEYIQRAKMESAKKNLEIGRKNVNEVMYEVGYSDRKAFRTTFKKITGLLPLEYRNKYNKEAAVPSR